VQQERTHAKASAEAGAEERLTYTLTEAARRLGISRALAYEAAHRGELPICRIGRRMLVPRAALMRLLEDSPLGARSASSLPGPGAL
jgi:excisionase family DNA binding protein